MTTSGETTTDRAGRVHRPVLLITALVSLVLSPITAVWAMLLGPLLLIAGAALAWLRPRERGMLLVSAGLGVIVGVLPYFLLAAVQA